MVGSLCSPVVSLRSPEEDGFAPRLVMVLPILYCSPFYLIASLYSSLFLDPISFLSLLFTFLLSSLLSSEFVFLSFHLTSPIILYLSLTLSLFPLLSLTPFLSSPLPLPRFCLHVILYNTFASLFPYTRLTVLQRTSRVTLYLSHFLSRSLQYLTHNFTLE